MRDEAQGIHTGLESGFLQIAILIIGGVVPMGLGAGLVGLILIASP